MALDPYNATNVTGNGSAQWQVSEASTAVTDMIVDALAGRAEFVGLLLFVVIGYIVWKAEVDNDVLLVVGVPTALFASRYGWLPGGDAVTAGVVLVVAAVGAVAVGRLFD